VTHVRFTVLGRVGATVDDVPVPVPGRRERAVLAVLLAAHGAAVPTERLVHQLWGPDASDGALSSLQVAVSRLRRLLEPDRGARGLPRLLVSLGPGYALLAPADDVDAERFLLGVRSAHAALASGDAAGALARAEDAAALWAGEPYADVAGTSALRAEVARLEDARAWGREVHGEALLALGRHAEAAVHLEALGREEPLREGVARLHALALYRGGRPADALAVLRRSREALRDELGVDPSAASRELETAVLRQDPALDAGAQAAASSDGGLTRATPRSPAPSPAPVAPDAAGSGGPSAPTAGPPAPPLVGRDAEFGRLRALVSDALQGVTGLALVEGPPGIGKTRLLEEVARYAESRGALAVWGRCSEPGTAPAYWPWLEVLRRVVRAGLCPDPPVDLQPLLGSSGPPPAGPPREEARFALFQAVAQALQAAAAQRALVVLVEDLHWADPASAELLAHLAVRLHEAPVVVIGTLRELDLGRQDAVVGAVSAVARRSGPRLSLGGIPATAGPALVAGAVGREVPADVAAAIHRRAEGNPFGIGELSRLLARDGLLAEPLAVDRAEVPAGVRDVVRDRLAALPPATRSLLEVAAVVGRAADLPVLVRAAGRSEPDVLDALEPALTSRILVPVADAPGRHRFAHALVREAALADLSSLHAARLHAAVADALAATGGRRATAEVVADHLWAAAALVGRARAAQALEAAAGEALARTAYEAAESQLDRALALRQAGDGSAEDDAAELTTALRLLALRVARHGFGPGCATSALPRAKELARSSGRVDLYLALLTMHWGALCTTGQVPAAHALAAEMRALCGDAPDPVLRAVTTGAWGVQQWHEGRVAEAARLSADVLATAAALDAADQARLVELGGGLTVPFALYLADLGRGLGDVDDRFEQLAAVSPEPYAVVVSANFAALAAVCAGDAPRAERWSARALGAGLDAFSFFGSAAQVYHGWAVARLGDPAAGVAELEAGSRRYLGTGARTCWGMVADLLADARLLAGRDPAEVAADVADGRALVEATGERWALPYLDLADARAAAASGAPGAVVREHLDAAAARARVSGVRPVVATAARLTADLAPTPAE
jgi:DNA-binding SARP family transcriptional activator